MRTVQRRRKRKVRRVLSLLSKATRLNLEDPLRRGMLVQFPLVGELMVTGDLHGHKANFDRIVELADLARNPQRHLLLQEIIHQLDSWKRDRDLSYLVLEKVAQLKVDFPEQVHILMGNHELSEVQGRVLYKDGRMLNNLFDKGIVGSYGPEDGRLIKNAYKRFFRSMALAGVTETHLFFCHSIPEAEYVDRYDREFFMQDFQTVYRSHDRILLEEVVWGRDFSSEVAERYVDRVRAEIVMIGHEPCAEGHDIPNPRTVILDSKDENGCYCLLRLNQPYSQKGIIKKICRLH